jgi:hypothetical protein
MSQVFGRPYHRVKSGTNPGSCSQKPEGKALAMTQEHAYQPEQETPGAQPAAGSGCVNWYLIYCAAMLESDRNRALVRIESAQQAIQDRIAQLRFVPAKSGREVSDLSNALTQLGILLEQLDYENERTLWD